MTQQWVVGILLVHLGRREPPRATSFSALLPLDSFVFDAVMMAFILGEPAPELAL